MKKLNPNQFKEKEGLNAIATIVNRMGCTWRPTPNDDYGIDGEIEINKEGAPTGKILKVQSKSGKSYVKSLTDTRFNYYADEDDLEYWLRSNIPVILIVMDFSRKIFHWVDVKSYVERHPEVRTAPHKITFSLKYNKFSVKSFFDLCKSVMNENEFVEVTKNKISEEILSNLLPIEELPTGIFGANCELYGKEIINKLKDKGVDIPSFYCVDSKLWTFSDLFNESNILREVCDTNNITVVRAQDWILDEDKRKWYVVLLKKEIIKHCRKMGLKLDDDKQRIYFPPTKEGTERVIRFKAFTRIGTRKVAYPYIDKRGNNPFWVHHSLDFKIESYGGNWFLRINPGYIFTRDGYNFIASDRIGRLATRRKAKEWNRSVLNHLIFWRETLSKREPSISIDVGGKQKIIINKSYESGLANFGIMKDKKKLSDMFSFEGEFNVEDYIEDEEDD